MLLKIGEVAAKLGITPRAIRHYEDLGLVTPHEVTESNYRLYSQRELVLLDNIVSLAKLGIPLGEIKKVMDKYQQDNLTDFQQVKEMLKLQLETVEAEITKLTTIRDVISQAEFTLDLNQNKPLELVKSIALTLEKNRPALDNWQDRWSFDEQAKYYDAVTGKAKNGGYDPHENYDDVLEFVSDMATGNVVLDIGIGTGNLAEKLVVRGKHVIGIDQSREMLRKAKEKLPETEMLEANMLALPLEDQSVDGVTSTYVLHHLPTADKKLALDEMVRVLRPGGQILLGDNMFLDQDAREQERERLLALGKAEDWEDIEDEYLANVIPLAEHLKGHGLSVSYKQMATYTWVIWAKKSRE